MPKVSASYRSRLYRRTVDRNNSGSFTIQESVDSVKQQMTESGVSPTKATARCVESEIWDHLNAGHLTVRSGPEGELRFKLSPEYSEACKAARRELPENSPLNKVGRFMNKRLGGVPRQRKNELHRKNAEKNRIIKQQEDLLVQLGAGHQARREAASTQTEESNGNDPMNIDSDVFNDGEGSSNIHHETPAHNDVPPPRTPQRVHATQSYPSPPDTTSPLSRQLSQARFQQPVFSDPQTLPVEGSEFDVDGGASAPRRAAGVGPSVNVGSDYPQNPVHDKLEQIILLAQGARHEAQQRDAELRSTRADLDTERARRQLLQEECEVEHMVRIEAEDERDEALAQNQVLVMELDDALGRNEVLIQELDNAHGENQALMQELDDAHGENQVLMQELDDAHGETQALVEKRDVYQMKHWGAEAALKGSRIQYKQRANELERSMLAAMSSQWDRFRGGL